MTSRHAPFRSPSRLALALAALLLATGLAPAGARAQERDEPPALVDLNHASAAELESLPGIGPAKAARIIEYRARRPFRTVEELVRVSGFGPKTVARLRAQLKVERAEPATQSAARSAATTTAPAKRADGPAASGTRAPARAATVAVPAADGAAGAPAATALAATANPTSTSPATGGVAPACPPCQCVCTMAARAASDGARGE